ncbi:MAG: SPOR domain-containing protein [Bacteroidota bacterium]
MHVSNEQFINLLAEALGKEAPKVKKQLKTLIKEINKALDEGDSYEIENFGVLSRLGSNTIFLPDSNLETEVNYKYVGMEPIELEPASEVNEADEELQISGILDDIVEPDTLVEDAPETVEDIVNQLQEEEQDPEKPGPEVWGIKELEKDKRDAEFLVSSLLGEDQPEPTPESDTEESDIDWIGDEIFETSGSDTEEDLADELSSLMALEDEESQSVELEDATEDPVEEAQTNSLLEDLIAEEEAEELVDQILPEHDDILDEEEEQEVMEESVDEVEDPGLPEDITEEPETDEDEEHDLLEQLSRDEDGDEFDDPFADLDEQDDLDEFDPDQLSKALEEDIDLDPKDEDIFPVIKNVSSGISKEPEPAPVEQPPVDKKKEKTSRSDQQSAPVLLWVVLVLVILAGGTYLIGFFGIVSIPGITPNSSLQVTQAPASNTPPPVQATPDPVSDENTSSPASTEPDPVPSNAEAEDVVPAATTASVTLQTQTAVVDASANQDVPASQEAYGLTGVPNTEANDGYTIIIYSLSNEANARSVHQKLINEGYRSLLFSIPSSTYGTLWRVGLGQFRTQADAAIAGEELPEPYSNDYLIKKIQ